MEFITLLRDTPIPTLLVIIGGILLFVGLATIKKPIIIEVDPKSRKASIIIGISLLIIGSGLYLFPQSQTSEVESTSTPTIEPTLIAIQNTPTVAMLPSNTPDTPVSITETPVPSAINGLENNCISSDFWTPYTVNIQFPRQGNCWDLSSRGITNYKGELLFAVKNASEQSASMYMLLPDSGTISFDIKVDKYVVGGKNGNIAFGLGNNNDWLQAGKFIFLRITEPGLPVYYVYGDSVTRTGETVIESYKLGTSQRITFEVKNLILNIYIGDKQAVPTITLLPNERKVFWIGYRLPQNSEFVATISNLVIEK